MMGASGVSIATSQLTGLVRVVSYQSSVVSTNNCIRHTKARPFSKAGQNITTDCHHAGALRDRESCSSFLAREGLNNTSRQAFWLTRDMRDHSCGTALDLHQLPPVYPSIRAYGSPRQIAYC